MKNHTIKKKFLLASASLIVAVMLSACNGGDVSNVNLEDAPGQNDPVSGDPADNGDPVMNMPEDNFAPEPDDEAEAGMELPDLDAGTDAANSDSTDGFDEEASGEFDLEESDVPDADIGANQESDEEPVLESIE